jgi:hypothetical protein
MRIICIICITPSSLESFDIPFSPIADQVQALYTGYEELISGRLNVLRGRKRTNQIVRYDQSQHLMGSQVRSLWERMYAQGSDYM